MGERCLDSRGVRRREQAAPEEEPRRSKRDPEAPAAGLAAGELGLLGQAVVGVLSTLCS